MSRFLTSVLCAALLANAAAAAPAPQLASSAPAVASSEPAAISSSAPESASSAPAVASSAASIVAPVISSGTASASAEEASPTVPYASNNPNLLAWNPATTSGDPQPIRYTSNGDSDPPLGASILGPQNVPIDIQNPDLLAPPTTDAGTV